MDKLDIISELAKVNKERQRLINLLGPYKEPKVKPYQYSCADLIKTATEQFASTYGVMKKQDSIYVFNITGIAFKGLNIVVTAQGDQYNLVSNTYGGIYGPLLISKAVDLTINKVIFTEIDKVVPITEQEYKEYLIQNDCAFKEIVAEQNILGAKRTRHLHNFILDLNTKLFPI